MKFHTILCRGKFFRKGTLLATSCFFTGSIIFSTAKSFLSLYPSGLSFDDSPECTQLSWTLNGEERDGFGKGSYLILRKRSVP